MSSVGDVNKLIKTITESAEAEAQKIIGKAKEKADEIIRKAVEEAKSKAESEASEIIRKERDEALRKRRSEVAKARMEAFRRVLDYKEKLIKGVVEEARKRIQDFVKSESYRKKLEEMIKDAIKVLGGGTIELKLNERDSKLGIDLKALANEVARELNKAVELKLSSEVGNFTGGLIARSIEGGIEVDYTIEGILDRKWRNLRIEVAKILFGE